MIFVLTGAGLSAESGLGTFRDTDGLWTKYDLNEVATPEGYARNPSLVLDFYNARRANAAEAEPNAAHRALAELQAGRETFLVTQNVDALLDRAGAREVLHMHGRLDRAVCAKCGARSEAPAVMDPFDHCCGCGATQMRPDVVWFGEMPQGLEEIDAALDRASLFVAIGTSGTVYPAAGFVAEAEARRVPTLEINLEPSGARFDDGRYGKATETVPAWVAEILG